MLIDHLNTMISSYDGTLDQSENTKLMFKLENTFQLLTLCLTSKKFIMQIQGVKKKFLNSIKNFLENSYTCKMKYTPPVMAKSLLCTIVVILELFPVSLNHSYEFLIFLDKH